MNTKKRGQRVELLCSNELKKAGYTILYKTHTCKMGPFWKGWDFANLFDVVAFRLGRWLFVGCTSTMSHYADQRALVEIFSKKHRLDGMDFEFWIRVRGGFRKFWLTPSGWVEQKKTDGETVSV